MLFCGVDIGTTNVKIALFDETGRKLHVSSEPTPRRMDAHGTVTDAEKLVEHIRDRVIAAWAECGRGQTIGAISTTGVGEDGILVDKELKPYGFSIPWFDKRAASQADLLRNMDLPQIRAGIAIESSRTVAKWLWIYERNALAARAAEQWISLTDYPLVVWGGKAFMSDTIASRTGAFDPVKRCWIDEILAASKAPPLPPVLAAGTEIGRMVDKIFLASGAVDERTLLVAGGHDHPVAALAIHALRPNARIDSLGTANVIYADAPSFEITALDDQIAFMASIHGPGRLACLSVFEFSEALKSFRGGIDGVNLLLEFDRVPGEPGNLKGAPFFGARSILEWSTFQSMKLFSRIAELGVASAPIYSTGGWSRFSSLIELRASMYGEPIYVPDEHELTVVGACMLAALPTGRELAFDCNVAVIEPHLPWAEAYREIALEALMREIQIEEK